MADDFAIKVENVSKTFKLPHEKSSSIKSHIVNFWRHNKGYELQEALKDVSFEVKKGEFFGIVGRNGSGKSTLLKLLAGIYTPTEGQVHVRGKLTPFIELGVGFNPELTGRENVFLNGALLGFNRKEMEAMYDSIVEFAELSRFMDQKLKNYSSGMQVRLAFSIAIRAKSEILLVDEVLAVGDSSFQKKCYETFYRLKEEGRTIVFVTHDMNAVERFCDKVLVIDNSQSKGIFTPNEAGSIYDELNAANNGQVKTNKEDKKRWGSGEVLLDDVTFYSGDKELGAGTPAETGKELEIALRLSGKKPRQVTIGLAFIDAFGVNIAGPNSIGKKLTSAQDIKFKIDRLSLLPGEYKMTVAVFDSDAVKEYDHHEKGYVLNVKSAQHNLYGKVSLFGEWTNT